MPKLSIKYMLGIFLIYAELLIIGLRSYVYDFIKHQYPTFISMLDSFIRIPWLIIISIIVLVFPIYYIIEREYKFHKISPFRLVFFAITTIMFFSLIDNPLPGGFGLFIALGCFFSGLFVLELIKLWWNEVIPNDGKTNKYVPIKKGFSSISKKEDLYDLGWDGLAKNLYNKLSNTNVEEAYAVGVNAEWGYGKTTFLEQFQSNISISDIKIVFNPWLSSSTDQIVKDFFENLKDKLREYDYLIDDDIDNYVKLLVDLNVNPFVSTVAKLLGATNSKSLSHSRDLIQKRINNIGKRIFVLIDDLDRLEKDEIYEVMKLVRNTAKFKNLIYVVTYDRNYICSTLREKGIVSPETYLYKIFQMEMLLPSFEGDLIEKKLLEELRDQLVGNTQLYYLNAIKDEINKARQTPMAIGHFLKNFRDAKRFANNLSLEIEHIASEGIRYDILPWGLFWLEIIHYSHEDFFLKLRNNYSEFLEESDYNGRLELKKNLKNTLYGEEFPNLKYPLPLTFWSNLST